MGCRRDLRCYRKIIVDATLQMDKFCSYLPWIDEKGGKSVDPFTDQTVRPFWSRNFLFCFVLDRMFTLVYELVSRNARAVLIMSSPLRIA